MADSISTQAIQTSVEEKLSAVYDNYKDEQFSEIVNAFMGQLIYMAEEISQLPKVSRVCFNLISDLRTILGEIVGNGLRHGVHPTCEIKIEGDYLVAVVMNERTAEDNGVFPDCGRGMTIIKELIMEHQCIHIIHAHEEDAFKYTAYLKFSLPDFTAFIEEYCTPPTPQA